MSLFTWPHFELRNHRLRKILNKALRLFTHMINTNNTEQVFYEVMVVRNNPESPT